MNSAAPSNSELESIEQHAWSDMFDAAPAQFAAGAGLSHGSVSGMACYAVKAAPTVQFNRAQAYDWSQDGDLSAVISWLASRCSPQWALQLPVEVLTQTIRSSLESAGLAESGGWTKFIRPVAPPAGVESGPIEILHASLDQAHIFGQTIQQGFAAPLPFALWSARLVGRKYWTTFLALEDDEIVGAASLYVSGELGWLGMGCCLPEARRRGVQTALLAQRINHARDLGAKWVVSETGTPQRADTEFQASYHNLKKLGFAIAYQRLSFCRQRSGPDVNGWT